MKRCVDVLVGLQWGSEGKGLFAAALASRYNVAVRVGGPNAGHTFYLDDEKFVCRSVPCGWVNDECDLYIGPGAVIAGDELALEIEEISMRTGLPIASRITIDPNAVLIRPWHIEAEKNQLAYMGSTMHGIGAALMEKTGRLEGCRPLVRHAANMDENGETGTLVCLAGSHRLSLRVAPVARLLHSHIGAGDSIILEGTQGTLLSIDHGDWPYVTSRNVIAGSLLSDCGVPPLAVRHVFGVLRTYPIRVGGTSGPMGTEISWAEVARRAGLPTLTPERTTVTNRARRIALIDLNQLEHAVRLNGCTGLFVSFLDYIDGRIANRTADEFSGLRQFMENNPELASALASFAAVSRVPVVGVSWGPKQNQCIIDTNLIDSMVTSSAEPNPNVVAPPFVELEHVPNA